MLPVPVTLPVSQLLSRCSQHYAGLARSSSHKYIRAKRIFVRDLFEIADHRQLVGDCFTDFIEVTVKAIIKPKDVDVKPVTPSTTVAPAREALAVKKFTNEPTPVSTLNKSFQENVSKAPIATTTPQKRQKLDAAEKTPEAKQSSPEKESKNARKKRERKALEKQLKASASKHRQSESLSDSEDEQPAAVKQAEPEPESDASSKHDIFIRSISNSIQNYSLEKASSEAEESSDFKNKRGGRLSSSSLESSAISIEKKTPVQGRKRSSLDDLISSSDEL